MPIKKTGVTLPAGLEAVKDLKHFYTISSNALGKDFKSVDVTSITSFIPAGVVSDLVLENQFRRNLLEITGASWINISAAASTAGVALGYDSDMEASSLDYYYFTKFGTTTPYFDSTKGSTAGNTYYFDKWLELYQVSTSGTLSKLTTAPSKALNGTQAGSQTASFVCVRVFYEDDNNFYIQAWMNLPTWGYHTQLGANSQNHYMRWYSFSKSTLTPTNLFTTNNWQASAGIHSPVWESSTAIVFASMPRGGTNNVANNVPYNHFVFNKNTGTMTVNAGANNTYSSEVTWKSYQCYSATKAVMDPVLNVPRSYFTYEDQATRTLSIKMQKYPTSINSATDVTIAPNIVACTTASVPTNLLRNLFPTVASAQLRAPTLCYGLTQFTDNNVEYLVLHVYPIKDLVVGEGPQRHIVFNVDPTDSTKLTYVSHYEVPGTSYSGVLPSADGKSILLVNDFTFFLLNWNSGTKTFIPSRVITTPSIIKRAAFDSLNQIWINTNADVSSDITQDSLDIYYPTGTKYVSITTSDPTTQEYAGVTIQPTIKVSVFNLNGARVAQNVTLEIVGGTFIGGSNAITIQTSASDDVSLKINIDSAGSVTIVATDF